MDKPPDKKPPAPSVSTWRAAAGSNVRAQIAREIFIALQQRGADKLLSILDRYADMLSDEEALLLLQEYNATGRAQRRPP